MSCKLYKMIFLGIVFSFVTAIPVRSADFRGLKPAKIIKIDKVKHCPVLKPLFSRRFQRKAESVLHAPIVYIESSPLADCYREQPLLFSFLAMFITVTLTVLGFIFHMIRNDPRFY